MSVNETIEQQLSIKDSEKDEKVNLWGGLDVTSIIEKHKISLAIGLLGMVLILGGILLILKSSQPEDEIEIIPAEETKSESKIKADVEGAVIKPGVYELDFGSRVNDLLIMAGGLSANADREWVQMTLNLAQKVTDGTKIYIPNKKEVGSGKVEGESTTGSTGTTSITSNTNQTKLININTASAAELDTLWGVGPATAQKIIDNRPYQAIEDLINKKVVYKNVFEKIKGLISVY